MMAEQRELYNYVIDHFSDDLKRITPNAVSPIIAIRQVVKRAMNQYIANYCSDNQNPFSESDFKIVCKMIRSDIV